MPKRSRPRGRRLRRPERRRFWAGVSEHAGAEAADGLLPQPAPQAVMATAQAQAVLSPGRAADNRSGRAMPRAHRNHHARAARRSRYELALGRANGPASRRRRGRAGSGQVRSHEPRSPPQRKPHLSPPHPRRRNPAHVHAHVHAFAARQPACHRRPFRCAVEHSEPNRKNTHGPRSRAQPPGGERADQGAVVRRMSRGFRHVSYRQHDSGRQNTTPILESRRRSPRVARGPFRRNASGPAATTVAVALHAGVGGLASGIWRRHQDGVFRSVEAGIRQPRSRSCRTRGRTRANSWRGAHARRSRAQRAV